MNDKIILTDLEYLCALGCTAAERSVPQRVLCSVELDTDTTQAANSGELADSICWASAEELISQLVTGQEWVLVEQLANRTANTLLQSFPSTSGVKVTIKKFALKNSAWVGVSVFRSRTVTGAQIGFQN